MSSTNQAWKQTRKARKDKGHKDVGEEAVQKMMVDESQLFTFMHQVNEVYQEHLKKPPPFARYILLGLQSTGKSTLVERLLKFPMNVVAEGTGTRCPLYVSCIHDMGSTEPECELTGCSACAAVPGRITHENVFQRVTIHNRDHVRNGFTEEPLRLKVRSEKVQNMFFVDLPGIITTLGQGEDRRKVIKRILKQEMQQPNTKLLVLLEPKEFSTNSIIDFVDSTLGNRAEWLPKTLFLMTKFDLRVPDSLTGGKSNRFLEEYWKNGIKPYMVITPTMQKPTEGMAEGVQYKERMSLLCRADDAERSTLEKWMEDMERAFAEDSSCERLDVGFLSFMGFRSAVRTMNEMLLEDTRNRLPVVLDDLKRRLASTRSELQSLDVAARFMNKDGIQLVISEVLQNLVRRIGSYLDGSLDVARKLPDKHVTLAEEIQGEEQSDWATRSLNHLEGVEESWRDQIEDLASRNAWPQHIQLNQKFLGGKQYQRALNFFKAVMVDRLPDPSELRPFVATAMGTLRGGLNFEDWEHATVEIIRTSVRPVSEAGITYFVKHCMHIFRGLLDVALEDLQSGERASGLFQHMPQHLRQWITQRYDELVWDIGVEALESCRMALEPFFSTINPALTSSPTRRVEPPQHKADASSFLEALSQSSLGKFFCALPQSEWKQCKKLGALYSARSLMKLGLATQRTVQTRSEKKFADYIVLSCSKEAALTNFEEKHGQGTVEHILLEVEPIACTWQGTVFTTNDANQDEALSGSLEALQAMLAAMAQGSIGLVLVKDRIPVAHVAEVKEDPSLAQSLLSGARKLGEAVAQLLPAKSLMKAQIEIQTQQRVEFLPSARSSMISDDEIETILNRAYEYIVALFQFLLTTQEFQFNHFLFMKFKATLPERMGLQLILKTPWDELAKGDPKLAQKVIDLRLQEKALAEALATVRGIINSAP